LKKTDNCGKIYVIKTQVERLILNFLGKTAEATTSAVFVFINFCGKYFKNGRLNKMPDCRD